MAGDSTANHPILFGSCGINPLTLAVFTVLALPTVPAQAIELTDFTEPNTEFDEAYVDLNASANDGNQEQASYNALLKVLIRTVTQYAKPYGLTGQLLETATHEPVFGDDTVHQLRNRLSYTYELGDTIDWLNAWGLSHQTVDDARDTQFTTNTLTPSFLYELTNLLDLNLTAALTDSDDDPNLDPTNDELASSVNLGLRYRVRYTSIFVMTSTLPHHPPPLAAWWG